MKKRLLACLLVLSLFATGLGFAPAAQAAEDGIAAQWTTKENLAPADREIVLQPDEGTLSEDDGSRISDESVLYQDSDVVTVIVELEEQPLLTRASGDVEVSQPPPRAGLWSRICGRPRRESKEKSGPSAAPFPPSLSTAFPTWSTPIPRYSTVSP